MMEDRNFLFHAEKYLLTFLARGYLRYMQTTVVLDVRSPRATTSNLYRDLYIRLVRPLNIYTGNYEKTKSRKEKTLKNTTLTAHNTPRTRKKPPHHTPFPVPSARSVSSQSTDKYKVNNALPKEISRQPLSSVK